MDSRTSRRWSDWRTTGEAKRRNATPMHEIRLNGIDGSNLLGYLAALGTFRVLSTVQDGAEVRMGWSQNSGWTPIVFHPAIQTEEGLLEVLEKRVCGED